MRNRVYDRVDFLFLVLEHAGVCAAFYCVAQLAGVHARLGQQGLGLRTDAEVGKGADDADRNGADGKDQFEADFRYG